MTRLFPMYLVMAVVAASCAAATMPSNPTTLPATRQAFIPPWDAPWFPKQTVYVAANGDDRAGNGTQAHPWQTVNRALNTPDYTQINVLASGGPLTTGIGTRNAKHHIVQGIGNPILLIDTTKVAGVTLMDCVDVRVYGLHFVGANRDPSKPGYKACDGGIGINVIGGMHLIIADNEVDHFTTGINLVGAAGNTAVNGGVLSARIVNNRVHDCFGVQGFNSAFTSQGIDFDSVDDFVISGGCIIQCGWNLSLPESMTYGPQKQSNIPYSHAVYGRNHANGQPKITGVFVARCPQGVALGSGGHNTVTATGNVFIENGQASDMFVTGTNAVADGNLFIGSSTCPKLCWGGGLQFLANAGSAQGNLFCGQAAPQVSPAITIDWASHHNPWDPKDTLNGLVQPYSPTDSLAVAGNYIGNWRVTAIDVRQPRPTTVIGANQFSGTSRPLSVANVGHPIMLSADLDLTPGKPVPTIEAYAIASHLGKTSDDVIAAAQRGDQRASASAIIAWFKANH